MLVSTVSAESAFSILRRLKTYLRNTMSQERLTGVALMYIHQNINLDINRVINAFDATGCRRIALMFNHDQDGDESSDEKS